MMDKIPKTQKSPVRNQKPRKYLANVTSSQTYNQENMTADLGTLVSERRGPITEKQKKRPRSKSIGPGGLDTLRVSPSTGQKLNSIIKNPYPALKPILKLQMPAFEETVLPVSTLPKNHNGALSTAKMTDNLIDVSVDSCTSNKGDLDSLTKIFEFGSSGIKNQTDTNPRAGEERDASTTKYGEREIMDSQNDVDSRREARRKSLAHRRVSFAPEATLHTWDVVVEYQDSTTSTNSTSSTKRIQPSNHNQTSSPNSRVNRSSRNSPRSPKAPEQVEKNSISVENCLSHSSRQKSSPRMQSFNPRNFIDSFSPSSSSGGSDEETAKLNEDDVISSESDSDIERTSITLDNRGTTDFTTGTIKSGESCSRQNQSKEVYQQAIHQSGTQASGFDKNKSIKTNEKLVAHFTRWSEKNTLNKLNSPAKIQTAKCSPKEASENFKSDSYKITKKNMSEIEDSTISKPQKEDADSMVVNRALSSIISKNMSKSISCPRLIPEKLDAAPPDASMCENQEGDTMDFTLPLGGIQIYHHEIMNKNLKKHDLNFNITSYPLDSNNHQLRTDEPKSPEKFAIKSQKITKPITEDGSLNMKTAIGEIIQTKRNSPMVMTASICGTLLARQDSLMDMTTDADGILTTRQDSPMDMTTAVGGILTTRQDSPMEMTTAVGGILTTRQDSPMDMTTAVGGILTTRQDSPMDMTTAVGGILTTRQDSPMEMTTAVGGILTTRQDSPMDMTTAVGGILTTRQDTHMDMTNSFGRIFTKEDGNLDVETANLDKEASMEVAIVKGEIVLPTQVDNCVDLQARKNMEPKLDPEIFLTLHKSRPNSHSEALGTTLTVISATGSPSLTEIRGPINRRNSDKRNLDAQRTVFNKTIGTPTKKLGPPPKQLTPLPTERPSTSSQASPSKKLVSKKYSPRRLYDSKNNSLITRNSFTEQPETPKKNYLQDEQPRAMKSDILPTPQARLSSGIGFDKTGLGSPRVAEILDRRGSICNQARSFVPGELAEASLGARLKDPRVIEQELERDVIEDDRNLDHALVNQGSSRDSKEKDATLHLIEMIHSLTPKKKPVKGRKSLLIGTAKGILGKRPVELDEADDDEDNQGVKRLKNHPESPVKNVRLHAPPSKSETTSGRTVKVSQRGTIDSSSDFVAPSNLASSENIKSSTLLIDSPKKSGLATSSRIPPGEEIEPNVNSPSNAEVSENQRIQLQDFLNMTCIRFMELTTTKRRHTIVPKTDKKGDGSEESNVSWEDCIAAGAATIPMLELFQHACHELKRYISEGRKTIREIETETWEENPPLFHEYTSASPDLKLIMDNQLKNVKTHSRLLSKELWYDWRMTLLGTLKEGLIKTTEDMVSDEVNLENQQSLLNSILPSLAKKAEFLQQEEHQLLSIIKEINSCNREELIEAHQSLIAVTEEVEAKKLILEQLLKQSEKIEGEIEAGFKVKQNYQAELNESEKIREECRGWTCSEINAIKRRAERIEKTHGWMITAISGTRISMTYQKDIALVFDALCSDDSPLTKQTINSTIDISYIGLARSLSSRLIVTEFFVQCIQNSLREQTQREVRVKSLLDIISTSWKKARKVMYNIHLLTLSCPTDVTKLSDTSMTVRSMLFIEPLATKVAINFHLTSESKLNEIEFRVASEAHVIYGERLNETKMSEFLLSRCGDLVKEKSHDNISSWGDAVSELEEKLIARRRK